MKNEEINRVILAKIESRLYDMKGNNVLARGNAGARVTMMALAENSEKKNDIAPGIAKESSRGKRLAGTPVNQE